MTISIIGHGYVGLVSAAVFADFGHIVYCVGRTPEKIEKLKKGEILFYEPGLAELVKKNVLAHRLKFTLSYSEAIPASDIVLICVGTPSSDTGEADLTQVMVAAAEIGKNLANYTVVVCKSTVPVGTNRQVAKVLEKNKKGVTPFDIASCPEFLREGTALHDTLHPDRIIIGAETEKAKKLLLELHKSIDGEFVITDIATAEMIKYAANSFLATKISFSNAISFLCDKCGADVLDVMKGIGLDSRIGQQFLSPGVGYGGSCFPKDVKALISISEQYGYDFSLLKAVEEINKEAWQNYVNKVKNFFGTKIKKAKLAVLGLAFKPDTDDMREAPSLKIINELLKAGAAITAYDPVAMPNAKLIIADKIKYASNPYEACQDADALLLITEWNEFKDLDLLKIKKLLRRPVIFDGRHIWHKEKM